MIEKASSHVTTLLVFSLSFLHYLTSRRILEDFPFTSAPRDRLKWMTKVNWDEHAIYYNDGGYLQ